MKRSSYLGVALTMLAVLIPAGPRPALAVSKPLMAHLTGAQVVPEVQTRATGQARFTPNADGTQLEFRVNVGNIENVTEVRLNLGAQGQTGEVVAILFGPVAPGGGRSSGPLAKGTIAQANLIGSLAGRPLADLLSAMRAGNVYIDVTTGSGEPDQKPGNMQSGEIRGQVR